MKVKRNKSPRLIERVVNNGSIFRKSLRHNSPYEGECKSWLFCPLSLVHRYWPRHMLMVVVLSAREFPIACSTPRRLFASCFKCRGLLVHLFTILHNERYVLIAGRPALYEKHDTVNNCLNFFLRLGLRTSVTCYRHERSLLSKQSS